MKRRILAVKIMADSWIDFFERKSLWCLQKQNYDTFPKKNLFTWRFKKISAWCSKKIFGWCCDVLKKILGDDVMFFGKKSWCCDVFDILCRDVVLFTTNVEKWKKKKTISKDLHYLCATYLKKCIIRKGWKLNVIQSINESKP